MSVDHALPTSTPLERDARLVMTDHKVAPDEIALGVVIGRTAEFFDFFVYGIASVLVFPHVFFPFVDPLKGTLYAFAVFSLAFIARPLGSLIFMWVDRRHGRGVKLTIALFLLGGSTAAIALLPTFGTIGTLAIILLSIFRFAQGFALGGAWDGLASLLALNAPQNQRGWYAMMPQLGAPLGFMLASALFSFFIVNLSSADFLDWGWRYPFYVAFAINVVALFARLRLVVTDEFAHLFETRELQPARIFEMLREQGRFVLIGAFAPLASFALFHLVTVFPLSWINLFTERSAGEFLMVQFAGAVVGAAGVFASGLIADRFGRRRHLAMCAILIAIFSAITPFLLSRGATGETVFEMMGFGLLGLTFGQAAGAVTSNFTSRNRYTGAALSSDLAWLIGAGFAPLVALGLSSHFGLAWVGVYLFSGAVCTLLALYFNTLEVTE